MLCAQAGEGARGEESRAELIRQIETTSVGGRLAQNVSGGDETGTLQLLVQQQNQVLQRLRSQPAVGRLVIKINSDISSWANTPADIELRSGDVCSSYLNGQGLSWSVAKLTTPRL